MAPSEDDKDDGVGKLGRMDRREFGKILVAGVGGLTLGKAAGAECHLPTDRSMTCPQVSSSEILDVIIVGAGLSGLIAARELKKANPKMKVIVLEANSYLGGRMVGRQTAEVQGGYRGYLDYGGQWVGETQYEMIGLAAELNIPLFLSYEKGRSIQSWKKDTPLADIYKDRTDTVFNGDLAKVLEGECVPPNEFPPEASGCKKTDPPNCARVADEEGVWGKLLEISKSVQPDSPWATPNAKGEKGLDNKTFQTWLEDPAIGAKGYTEWLPTLQSRIGGSGGFEPDQVSLLHMAWTQRVGPQSETPEKWLMCGGAGQIPGRLAKELAVCTDTPVTAIRQDPYSVKVTATKNGQPITYRAYAVIVAIPPSMRQNITIDLGANSNFDERASLKGFSEGSKMGSISKVHAVYNRAFWREKCLSGSAAGNLPTCEFIADSSPPGAKPGILTAFIGGKRNKEITDLKLSEDKVRDLVLRDFAYYFGEDALHPVEFCYFNWKDTWSGGAYTTYLGPNIWTKYGEKGWRKPVGNIFWAGTETSDRWPGYFDGAVRAGRTAAMAVLERLTETSMTKCP
jgi:monoamine oxidase